MKEIINVATKMKIANMQNNIVRNSLKENIKEDKVIKIITKEATEFIKNLFNDKKSKNKV